MFSFLVGLHEVSFLSSGHSLAFGADSWLFLKFTTKSTYRRFGVVTGFVGQDHQPGFTFNEHADKGTFNQGAFPRAG